MTRQGFPTATTNQVTLAPVTPLAAGRKMLDGLPLVNLFPGTVYPPETKGDFHCINIPHHTGAVCCSPVHTQPEVTHFVVILQIPPV